MQFREEIAEAKRLGKWLYSPLYDEYVTPAELESRERVSAQAAYRLASPYEVQAKLESQMREVCRQLEEFREKLGG